MLKRASGLAGADARVKWCNRRLTRAGTSVSLWRSTCPGHARGAPPRSWFGGLRTCGSIWECPVCAERVSRARRDDMVVMLDRARALGYHPVLVTWTVRHHAGQRLRTVLDGLLHARRSVSAARAYKSMKKSVGMVGAVKAIEMTHGPNGWHPHVHEIWILRSALTPDTMRWITITLAVMWSKYVGRAGLSLPDALHGITVQDGNNAAAYIAKWGLQSELSAAARKSAAPGHMTPWEILARASGNNECSALWREYVAATNGRRQLVRSRGLTKLLALSPEQSDLDLADMMPEERTVLCVFEWDDWLRILRDRADLSLLIAAAEEEFSPAEFRSIIERYGGHPTDEPTADNIGPYRPRCYATGVGCHEEEDANT